MPNSIIADYSKLKDALIKGSEVYLEERGKNKKPDYPGIGWYHGKKGITRAKNLIHCAKLIGMDNLCILALAIAIFRSGSSWLTTEIAYQLISGDYITYRGSIRNTKTLDSSSFNLKTLQTSDAIFNREGSKSTLNKKKTVWAFFDKAYKQEFDNNNNISGNVTMNQFNLKIKEFENFLDSDPSMNDTNLNIANFVS